MSKASLKRIWEAAVDIVESTGRDLNSDILGSPWDPDRMDPWRDPRNPRGRRKR